MATRGPKRDNEKYNDMADLYLLGYSYSEIGEIYGVSRQCVQQKLKRIGITYRDGGRHIRSIEKRQDEEKLRKELKDIHYNQYWGVTKGKYDEIIGKYGEEFADSYRKKKRNVELSYSEVFNISFMEYCKIWEESGKIGSRGLSSDSYVFTRKDFSKGWTSKNALITTLEHSSRRTRVFNQ